MVNRRRILLAAGVASVFSATVLGAVAWLDRDEALPEIAGFVYPDPKSLAPFALTRHDGGGFDLDSLAGKWTFAYFGFTSCPDVCPMTLVELNRVEGLLDTLPQAAENQYVFVTVDPGRDSPARLAEYVGYFNEGFIGVTGSDEALASFTADVGVPVDYPEGRESDHYPVDHASMLVLFDPNGQLHAVFSAPHRAEAVAEGFRRLLARWPT